MKNFIYGTALEPRVVAVVPTDDYKLYLTFSNGERRIFDAKPLLDTSVFEPLKDRVFFQSVKVDYGTVIWGQGIDYCPDTLYAESYPI